MDFVFCILPSPSTPSLDLNGKDHSIFSEESKFKYELTCMLEAAKYYYMNHSLPPKAKFHLAFYLLNKVAVILRSQHKS